MNGRISVFLVAENRLLREALARILRKKDDICVAGAAQRFPEAIQQVAESDCDVLVLDCSPDASSYFDFLREAGQRAPRCKVIMVGMKEEEDLFLKAVRAGAAGYLLKDASAMDVAAAVRAVAQGEAACPPRLCLSLFRYVARERPAVPNIRVQLELGLTRREQQLLPLIAQGLTNKEIATHLSLSEQTVKNHIHRMLHKVGASDRLTIVELCRHQGFDL